MFVQKLLVTTIITFVFCWFGKLKCSKKSTIILLHIAVFSENLLMLSLFNMLLFTHNEYVKHQREIIINVFHNYISLSIILLCLTQCNSELLPSACLLSVGYAIVLDYQTGL